MIHLKRIGSGLAVVGIIATLVYICVEYPKAGLVVVILIFAYLQGMLVHG